MWLGIAFLFIGIFATIIQAWLWSFPMEPDPGGPDPNGKSTAPRFWTNAHRILGLAFVLIYVYMMYKMVPRLWEYQVELPPRTVMHLTMGIVIGMFLIAKIAIIRWFQHFGKALPMLGYGILVCTVILSVLSLPFALQAHGFGTLSFDEESMQDLKQKLVKVEFAAGLTETAVTDPGVLATKRSLFKGRRVLMGKCVKCHDMRTILAKPRPPQSWHNVVVRMAEKPTLGSPMTDADLTFVTAYLIAITPKIKKSNRRKSVKGRSRASVLKGIKKSQEKKPPTADSTATPAGSPTPAVEKASPPLVAKVSVEELRPIFEENCTSCHGMEEIDNHGGDDEAGWTKVVQAMVEEMGAEISEEDARKIIQFLAVEYGK